MIVDKRKIFFLSVISIMAVLHIGYLLYRNFLLGYSPELFFSVSRFEIGSSLLYLGSLAAFVTIFSISYWLFPYVRFSKLSRRNSIERLYTGRFIGIVLLATVGFSAFFITVGLESGQRNFSAAGVSSALIALYTMCTIYCAMYLVFKWHHLSVIFKIIFLLVPLTAFPHGRFEVFVIYSGIVFGLYYLNVLTLRKILVITGLGVVLGLTLYVIRVAIVMHGISGEYAVNMELVVRSLDALFSSIDAGIFISNLPQGSLGDNCSACNGVAYAIPGSYFGGDTLTVGQRVGAAIGLYGADAVVGVPPAVAGLIFNEAGSLGLIIYAILFGLYLKVLDALFSQGKQSVNKYALAIAMFSFGPIFLFVLGAVDMAVAYAIRYGILSSLAMYVGTAKMSVS